MILSEVAFWRAVGIMLPGKGSREYPDDDVGSTLVVSGSRRILPEARISEKSPDRSLSVGTRKRLIKEVRIRRPW
jgi:hypothetical protein